MKRAFTLAVCMLVPTYAAAQDLAFSTGSLEACLEVSEFPENCIGEAAELCVNSTPGGYSTVAMGGCLNAEAIYWDGRLNAAYKKVRAQAKSNDKDRMEGAPSEEIALRDMQRAWIKYRDDKCGYAASLWGGGTGAGPAHASCVMTETGRQALFLEAHIGN